MIRKLLNGDIDRVADIWLKTNLKAHYFISNQYWKNNYELVKEMMPQSEVYVFEADKMKGTDLRRLFEAIASLHGEGVSGIRLEITKDGKLLNAFVGGKPLKDDQLYTVATIDYLADGNGRMDAFLQAEKRVCPEDATLRGLFLDYVRKQTAEGKAITSKLDGRITIK